MTEFGFSADQNGYMITYKGKPIGGAGVMLPRARPLGGKQGANNCKENTESARREIRALESGGGQARFITAMREIDATQEVTDGR